MTTTDRAPSVDISSLAVFRIGLGAILAIGAIRFMAEGWVDPLFVEPRFFFKYPGFSWVTVWPRWGMYLQYSVIAASALGVALGLYFRASLGVFVVAFAYAQLIDVTNYLNHYYLVVLLGLLMLLMPLNGAWSLDSLRRPELRRSSVPRWMLSVLRVQVAVVYIFAGLAKLGPDWLIHAEPLTTWARARVELPLIGRVLALPWAPLMMSWAAFLYDSTIPLWLSWRRTRPFAFAAVLTFHALTHVFFDIGLFPFLMTLGATLFFDPSWPRRFFPRGWPALRQTDSPPRPILRWLIVGYIALQIVVPLRAQLYDGDVLWHEQGMRWSWRVLAREKSGSVTYTVESPSAGRRWLASANDYLTWRQAHEMSGQPDLIWQLGQHIGDDFRRRGFPDVQVRVDAVSSLNGRRPSRLIDPTVDLLTVSDGVARAAWITRDDRSAQ